MLTCRDSDFYGGGAFARIDGLRHVWFITAIMCAYMITPLLQKIRKYSVVALPLTIAVVAVAYCTAPSLRYVFVFSWVYLYAIGYLFVNLEKKWRLFYIILSAIVICILCSNISGQDFRNSYHANYRLIHDVVGIFVVIVGVWLLSLFKKLKVPKIVSFLDKYSFHIFIVHFIIMCGPFSMAYITSYIGLNVVIMLLTSSLATFMFVKTTNLIVDVQEKIKLNRINRTNNNLNN